MCAWSVPRLWVVGEQVTAALLNAQVRDNLTHLGGTHAHDAAAGGGTRDVGALSVVSFSNTTASPTATGTLQRNGVHLEYHDGATALVLTLVDQAAGTASLRTLGTTGSTAISGSHGHL